MTSDAPRASRLPEELPDIDWITDPQRVARLSQDFAWFSPVLKRELAGKLADIAVRPRTEAEIKAVVAACARERVPITVRGSGTGNYGQSTPLHGGVILDLSGYNGFGWVAGGVGRAQAGIRLADFDKQARPQGWELRWLPSTFRSATLGGLFGGGFGGAGSITYGPVAAAGNVLGARVMSVEPEPQVTELRSAEAMLLHHTYGTNGIVLELEVALAPALPWLECIAVFDAFDGALEFASTLNAAPGIVRKEVCFLAAPLPDLMTPLADSLPKGCHAVLMLVAASSEPATIELAQRFGGRLTYRKTDDEVRASNRTLIEYTWNHTTLVALRSEKNLTYIQSGFEPGAPCRAGQGPRADPGRRGADAPRVPAHQGRRLQLQRPATHPLQHRRSARSHHADAPRPRRRHQQSARLHRRGRPHRRARSARAGDEIAA